MYVSAADCEVVSLADCTGGRVNSSCLPDVRVAL